ncbi:hypothetical protein H0H93_000180 [Arthromyces matolae]|nr:hypothetical protein H0H93_000180 [Arthromyces matolae]
MSVLNFPEHLNISPSKYPARELQLALDDGFDSGIFGNDAQRLAIQTYGIAGRIWKELELKEAAYSLNVYIDPSLNLEFEPPFIGSSRHVQDLVILELGSGTGFTTSRIAKLLKHRDIIIATDLPEFLRKSVQGGNQIYFPELFAPLLRTLLQLTSPPFNPEGGNEAVIISYKLRSLSKETPFWSSFGLWFEFKPVLVKDITSNRGEWDRFGSSSSADPVFVFVGHRRPESFSWEVPSDDSDLLGGRGAWGNDSLKSDDTFETLLFMSLDDIMYE